MANKIHWWQCPCDWCWNVCTGAVDGEEKEYYHTATPQNMAKFDNWQGEVMIEAELAEIGFKPFKL